MIVDKVVNWKITPMMFMSVMVHEVVVNSDCILRTVDTGDVLGFGMIAKKSGC